MTEPGPSDAPLGTAVAPCAGCRPRIYVACLAAYNAGHLHGAWIDASTPDEVGAEVSAMLRASPEPGAEEHAIHDHESFEGASISEWAGFDAVCALAAFIAQHGALGAKLYSHFGDDLEQAENAFEAYAGRFRSAAEFAEETTRETGTKIPSSLEAYIDWEALARDLELGGDIVVFHTGFDEAHIFWSR
jgi:antirestriction protein